MLFNFSNSELAYFCLFLVAFTFLVTQALTKKKQLVHILFAIFCASLCMMTIQKMTASSIGVYQYLIGFAACATCNVSWLISRSLFRVKNAVTHRHVLVAVVIAVLIMANQAWHMVNALQGEVVSSALMLQIRKGLSETTNLLSSTILLLTFWEALRGFSSKSKAEKRQRIIFASAFFIAVFSTTFIATVFVPSAYHAQAFPWFVFAAATLIIVAIQFVLLLQQSALNKSILTDTHRPMTKASLEPLVSESICNENSIEDMQSSSIQDQALVNEIHRMMFEDKIYLQSNIKVLDFARVLNAPEYKVSRLIKSHFKHPNFNHFINHYRVEYAKELLTSDEASNWSILVIGLESGFSSLVSFNRAFKHLCGEKPSAYRPNALQD
jgi:AraC-like DNA-binding protein